MGTKEILAVGFIVVFLSVAILPQVTLHTVKAVTQNDGVEVTTQVRGIPGYNETTVLLTREQYKELDRYLVRFKAGLNQTSTRDDAVCLFNDAVIQLKTYGLLPQGMSVAEAQRLVTGGYKKQLKTDWMKSSLQDSLNSFCLFAAITKGVIDYNIWVIAGGFLSSFIAYDSPLILLVYFLFFVGIVKPLRLFNMLVVAGNADVAFYFTLGLQGVSAGFDDISAVIGFSGLKILLNSQNALYLGGAVSVTSQRSS